MVSKVIPFCLVNHPKPILEKGEKILGLPLKYIENKEISLIYLEGEFAKKKNKYDNKRLILAALKHGKVINAFMENYNLIPFRFDTTFESKQTADKWLSKNALIISNELRQLYQKCEMRIWIKDYIESKITITSSNESMPITPGKAYLQKKIQGYTREKAIQTYAEKLASTLTKALGEVHIQHKIKIKNIEGKTDLKIDFLIEKSEREFFIKQVKEVLCNYSFEELHITGPWPIYHFLSPNFLKEIA